MGFTALYDTIYKFYYIIHLIFQLFSIFLAKKFQFQLNKLFLNKF